MSEVTVSPTERAKLRLHKHQYLPAPQLVEASGVEKKGINVRGEAVYTGTKADLVSMGLAPEHLFPGEHNMPAACVVLWPPGTLYGAGYRVPGRLSIARLPSGKFTAALMLTPEELSRRKAHDQMETLRQVEAARADTRRRLNAAARSYEGPTRPDQARAAHLRLAWSAPHA